LEVSDKNNRIIMKKATSVILLALRVAIGWHFLYEGIYKLAGPEWSARAYLGGSYGFLSGFYHWIAGNATLMGIVDILNVWGLVLIGSGLLLGIFIRAASLSGIVLLMLYYFAYPPFGDVLYGSPEGHYWIVNRNLLEALALLVVFILPAADFSIISLFRKKQSETIKEPPEPAVIPEETSSRRNIIKGLITLPFFGSVAVAAAMRENGVDPDARTGATMALQKFDLRDLKGELPKGKLGNLEISRMIMGCNLIGGYAHARDLLYANNLFRHYNSEKKIMETLSLAEQCGINTLNTIVDFYPWLKRYRDITGSKMNTICQIHMRSNNKDPFVTYKKAVDAGAETMYLQGAHCDTLVQEGRFDLIAEFLEKVRALGKPAGIGAHSIQGPIQCLKNGIKPDYYFKTMHHDNYWSAHPREFRKEFTVDEKVFDDHNSFHDNIFDLFPEQTIDFFRDIDVPLVGFKVLAAGAIKPENGFRYAFENGADFICVGMFDFQVVQDVNIVNEILASELKRNRPWYS
jgi:uncharacterized membrane protein YphA (DoxX/SURF4 family)